MEEMKNVTLEEQVAALQAQINLLMKGRTIAPSRRLESIRQKCRAKYFGTRNEFREGKVQFGPNGKGYSDYSAITEIINKTTGILFKYSKGKSAESCAIVTLMESEEDARAYEAICEKVCKSLLSLMDESMGRKNVQNTDNPLKNML